MGNWTRRGFLGSLPAAAATPLAAQQSETPRRTGHAPVKITDLRCAIIGRNPTVRVVTDQGISGYGQAESAKPYLKPMVLFYRGLSFGRRRDGREPGDAEDPADGCVQALGFGRERD